MRFLRVFNGPKYKFVLQLIDFKHKETSNIIIFWHLVLEKIINLQYFHWHQPEAARKPAANDRDWLINHHKPEFCLF